MSISFLISFIFEMTICLSFAEICSAFPKNGSVFYYDKSHKHGVFEHKSSFVKGSSQKLKNKKIIQKFIKSSPEVKKGDIIIHNSLTLHGSYKNICNKRRIGWTFCYKPKNIPYDLKRTHIFERKLFHQIQRREKN